MNHSNHINMQNDQTKCKSPTFRYFIVPIVLCIFILGHFGYLDEIKQLLENDIVSIHIGTKRLSLYLILRDLFIAIILVYLANLLSESIERRIRDIKVLEPGNRSLITKISQISIYFIFGITSLHLMGIDITTLAVFSGAIGIGIGIGLQKIASNFLSGIILLFEQAIREGDVIETSNGIFGTVKKIAARYVLVEMPDGKEVIIPNEDFITNHITNFTFSNTKMRVEAIIPLSEESDIEKAIEIIYAVSKKSEEVMKDHYIKCEIKDFIYGGVNLRLCFWVEDLSESLRIKSDVLLAIWKEFHKHNIRLIGIDNSFRD
ncbi:MAG: mechanosensitive ion channel [Rickettsiaceae bacterium]|nr:mechanosensitive ion channel [Rickettsiaceae bacterium]